MLKNHYQLCIYDGVQISEKIATLIGTFMYKVDFPREYETAQCILQVNNGTA